MLRNITKAVVVAGSLLTSSTAMAAAEEFKAVAFVLVEDQIKFSLPQYNEDSYIAAYAAQYDCQERFETECLIDNVIVAVEPAHAVAVNCSGEMGFASSTVSIEDAEEQAANSIGYASVVCSIVLIW